MVTVCACTGIIRANEVRITRKITEITLRFDKITELLFIAGNMPHLSLDEMDPILRFGMCV